MAADSSRPYGDSNLFLAWLNDEPGRADVAEAVLADAMRAGIRLTTSTFTLTEVAYTAGERSGADVHGLQRIDAAMRHSGLLRFIEVTERVALLGRERIRAAGRAGRRLTPADAVHLATAETSGATVFWTFDERLIDLAGRLDLPFQVGEPGSQ